MEPSRSEIIAVDAPGGAPQRSQRRRRATRLAGSVLILLQLLFALHLRPSAGAHTQMHAAAQGDRFVGRSAPARPTTAPGRGPRPGSRAPLRPPRYTATDRARAGTRAGLRGLRAFVYEILLLLHRAFHKSCCVSEPFGGSGRHLGRHLGVERGAPSGGFIQLLAKWPEHVHRERRLLPWPVILTRCRNTAVHRWDDDALSNNRQHVSR